MQFLNVLLRQLPFSNFFTEFFTSLMLLQLIFAFFTTQGYIATLKYEGFLVLSEISSLQKYPVSIGKPQLPYSQ